MRYWLLLSVFILFPSIGFALEEDAQGTAKTAIVTKETNKDLVICQDDEFKIEFLCSPEWDLHLGENAVLIIISTDPTVTLTIVKSESPYRFLSQITNEEMEKEGHYAPGFRKEDVKLGGKNALMVKAFAQAYPDIRFLEYYVIHESYLYNILFSVNPKEHWDEYKFLAKDITKSFKFME